MKVGIVYYGSFPWQRDIAQYCQNLKFLGHSSFVIAKPPKNGATGQTDNTYRVHHLPYNIRSYIGKWKLFHFPYNPLWLKWICQFCKDERPDFLIVRETPLSWVSQKAAEKLGIPVILDMRENLAAMYKAGNSKNVLKRVLRNYRLVRFFESVYVPKYNWIITVSKELEDWAVDTYHLNPQRVSVIDNFPDAHYLDQAKKALRKVKKEKNAVYMVYAGFLRKARGVGEVIEALPAVIDKHPQVVLRIIGEGDDTPRLKALTNQLGLKDNVEFIPMVPPEKLAEVLACCHIGLCPYWINEHTNLTMPGKLFEYMSVGLPILSSPRRPVKRIVESVGCGIIYESQRVEEIASGVIRLLADKTRLQEMGEKGRNAVLSRYNWKTSLATLSHVLDRLQDWR